MRRQRNRNAKKEAMQDLPLLMDKSVFDLSEKEFGYLLSDLCVNLGCCISDSASHRLREPNPITVDEFVERLFAAEGLPSGAKGSLRSNVKLYVQDFIAARRAS
jgi:hypothetical protein